MRKINEIILHCSATAEGKNFHASDIDKWHKAKGWKGIGYHFVIDIDGTIEPGRPVGEVGAHVVGHNTNSIGICYIGGCAKDGKTPKDTRTPAQKLSMYKLLYDLLCAYPKAEVHCHNEYDPKACPSFKIETLQREYHLWVQTMKITPKCNFR
jgi:N-acetylmuramoyl-L-alanine amidase